MTIRPALGLGLGALLLVAACGDDPTGPQAPEGRAVYGVDNANIVGTSYTNSVVGATTTVLFAIGSDLDALVTLPSPNSGQLTTVGALGVNTSECVGFDITGDHGIAYAALTTGTGSSALYTINLTTGQATSAGMIRGSALIGIAVAP